MIELASAKPVAKFRATKRLLVEVLRLPQDTNILDVRNDSDCVEFVVSSATLPDAPEGEVVTVRPATKIQFSWNA